MSIMNKVDVDNFLEHYGIMGMQWGRRSATVSINKTKAKKRLHKIIGKVEKFKDSVHHNLLIDKYDLLMIG